MKSRALHTAHLRTGALRQMPLDRIIVPCCFAMQQDQIGRLRSWSSL
jgi:hypothetical protein